MAVKKAPLNLRPKEKEKKTRQKKGFPLFCLISTSWLKGSGFKRIIQSIISDFVAIK